MKVYFSFSNSRSVTTGGLDFPFSLYLGAVIADAIGGHTFALIFLLIPVGGVAFGIWYRKKILGKVRSRVKNITIFLGALLGLALLSALFTFGIVSSRGDIFVSAAGFSNELPERYAALKLEDFGMLDEPHTTAFSKASSFVVPTSYEYHEISEEGVIRTRYYKARSSNTAAYIFQGMLEREGSLLYRSIKTAPASAWNADRAYYLKDDKTMILFLKDDLIILLDSKFDFSLPEVIAACQSKLEL